LRNPTPRQRIEAQCARDGIEAVVNGCVEILVGTSVDPSLLEVLAGPAARSVVEGAEGGLGGYWPKVWALRGFLYAWSDDAIPAVLSVFAHPSWRVREMAAKVVAKRVVGEAFDDVVRLRHDPTPRVRAAAERALAALVESGA